MAEWGKADPVAAWGASDPGAFSGRGTRQDPFDLSGGQSRASIPRGAFYRDPSGNIRRNDNGDRGNPIVMTPSQQKAMAGAQRDMRSRDEARAKRERTTVPQAALSQDRASALIQGYGFGLSDEIMGLRSGAKTGLLNLLGQDQGYTAREAYDARRRAEANRLAAYTQERPVESAVNTIGGAVLNPLNTVGGVWAGTSVPRAAAVGGVMGAAYGAGSAEPGERVKGAVKSGAIGAAASGALQAGANALGSAVSRAKAAPRPKRGGPVPTAEALRAAKEQAYQRADSTGVRYAPEAMDDLVASVERNMADARLNPRRHPRAASMLGEDFQTLRGTSPTLTELDQFRQVVRRDVAGVADEAEQRLGRRMIEEIDNFIGSSPKVVSGSATDAADLVSAARAANTRYMKAREIEDALGRADLRTASTGSGGNIDNAIRQNIRGVLERGRNYTPEERALMESIVRGSPGQNILRQVGKLSPQGNGLMAAGNLASAASFGPVGALPGLAGMGAKGIADRMTRQKVADLLRLVAEEGATGPGGGASPAALDALQQLTQLAAREPALVPILEQLRARLAAPADGPATAPTQPATALTQ
jgi:hypothetical protein